MSDERIIPDDSTPPVPGDGAAPVPGVGAGGGPSRRGLLRAGLAAGAVAGAGAPR